MAFLSRWQPHTLALMRIVSGFLFSLHGCQKVLGLLGGMGGKGGVASFLTLVWWAGFIELVGGLLLALGLFSRPVAFLCSGTMAVAYFKAHASRGFFPIHNGGELAALYAFVFFYLCFAGPGSFSLDRVLRKKT